MNLDMNNAAQAQPRPASSAWVGLARLVWTVLGPLLLLGSFFKVLTFGQGWFTAWDAGLFGLAVVMIGCRWVEQRSGHATTAYGDVSTWQHFRRYIVVVAVLAVVIWVIANVLGNYVIAS